MRVRTLIVLAAALLAPTLVAEESTATIVVSTKPSGATVSIDGQAGRTTPAAITIAVPEGTLRTVQIVVGFPGQASRQFTFVVGADETIVLERIAVLTPISSPRVLIKAPPELPGLIAASVCMKSS